MSKFKWLPVLALLTAMVFFAMACEDLEDEINDKTKKTENFSQDMKPGIPIKGMEGACTPVAINFDSLLSVVPVWDTVKEHIDEVKINELLYTADPNNNASEGWIGVYITDSGDYFKDDNGAPPESDMVAFTDPIPAGETIKEEPMNFTENGQETMESLLMEFDQDFYICAGWSGDKDDVDMTFLMTIDVDVVFVPL